MKKIIFSLALSLTAMLMMSSCASKKVVYGGNVPYKLAYGYYPKTDSCMNVKKITTEAEFNKYFSKIIFEDSTPIDFNKEFVAAIVYPQIKKEVYVDVTSVNDNESGTLQVGTNLIFKDKKAFTHQPMQLIVLDKKYETQKIEAFSLFSTMFSSSAPQTRYIEEKNKLIIK